MTRVLLVLGVLATVGSGSTSRVIVLQYPGDKTDSYGTV
jgi:hypothetical protein